MNPKGEQWTVWFVFAELRYFPISTTLFKQSTIHDHPAFTSPPQPFVGQSVVSSTREDERSLFPNARSRKLHPSVLRVKLLGHDRWKDQITIAKKKKKKCSLKLESNIRFNVPTIDYSMERYSRLNIYRLQTSKIVSAKLEKPFTHFNNYLHDLHALRMGKKVCRFRPPEGNYSRHSPERFPRSIFRSYGQT